jgi:hypothetical protein
MTTAMVIGSCLSGMPSMFLMSEYKWQRPTNAAVIRSDYFVGAFLDASIVPPDREEFRSCFQWKDELAIDGERWFNECFRDRVGTFEVPNASAGLFEVLENQQIDVVLMDNLHDTHQLLLRKAEDDTFALPFSLSRCSNAVDLGRVFHYGPPLSAIDSVTNWLRIIEFVHLKQPDAQIIFHCAQTCTMIDHPDRQRRAAEFYEIFAPLARNTPALVVPPLDLPFELTRLPEDADHLEWLVYKAMAGNIFLKNALRRGQRVPPFEE